LERIVLKERKANKGLIKEENGIFKEYYSTIERKPFIQSLDLECDKLKYLILINESNKIHLKHSPV
jgi:hypothetical protein